MEKFKFYSGHRKDNYYEDKLHAFYNSGCSHVEVEWKGYKSISQAHYTINQYISAHCLGRNLVCMARNNVLYLVNKKYEEEFKIENPVVGRGRKSTVVETIEAPKVENKPVETSSFAETHKPTKTHLQLIKSIRDYCKSTIDLGYVNEIDNDNMLYKVIEDQVSIYNNPLDLCNLRDVAQLSLDIKNNKLDNSLFYFITYIIEQKLSTNK